MAQGDRESGHADPRSAGCKTVVSTGRRDEIIEQTIRAAPYFTVTGRAVAEGEQLW